MPDDCPSVDGSLIVRPRLLGFRFGAGGGGGRIKAGEFGADTDRGLMPCNDGSTPVGCARGTPEGGGTLSDKFFAFLAFLLGDIDCGDEPDEVEGTIFNSSVEFLPMLLDVKPVNEVGLGGVSNSIVESVVDIVVVGEELFDDEAEEEVL